MMRRIWLKCFKTFEIEHPKSAKIPKKNKWDKKNFTRFGALKKQQRTQVVTKEICCTAFKEVMG